MKKKAFTILEMLLVMMIISLIGTFLFQIFSHTKGITKITNAKSIVCEEQINFYKTLKDDFLSSFLVQDGTRVDSYIAEIANIDTNFSNILLSFYGDRNKFSFVIKKRDVLNQPELMALGDTGFYKIEYSFDSQGLKRSMSSPVGLPIISLINLTWKANQFPPYTEDFYVINNQSMKDSYDIFLKEYDIKYFDGTNWQDHISNIPEQILITIKMSYKEEAGQHELIFKHVFKVK